MSTLARRRIEAWITSDGPKRYSQICSHFNLISKAAIDNALRTAIGNRSLVRDQEPGGEGIYSLPNAPVSRELVTEATRAQQAVVFPAPQLGNLSCAEEVMLLFGAYPEWTVRELRERLPHREKPYIEKVLWGMARQGLITRIATAHYRRNDTSVAWAAA